MAEVNVAAHNLVHQPDKQPRQRQAHVAYAALDGHPLVNEKQRENGHQRRERGYIEREPYGNEPPPEAPVELMVQTAERHVILNRTLPEQQSVSAVDKDVAKEEERDYRAERQPAVKLMAAEHEQQRDGHAERHIDKARRLRVGAESDQLLCRFLLPEYCFYVHATNLLNINTLQNALQKDTFQTIKDALSQGKRPPFAIQGNDEAAGSNTEVAENKTLRPNGRLGFKVPGKRPLLLN